MTTMHTPGPWTVSQPTDELHAIRGENGRIVADVGYSGTLDGDAANARLIAATPDLLNALMALSVIADSSLDYRPGFRAAIALANIALFKATGAAP